jgi:hypothetical protein
MGSLRIFCFANQGFLWFDQVFRICSLYRFWLIHRGSNTQNGIGVFVHLPLVALYCIAFLISVHSTGVLFSYIHVDRHRCS